MASIMILFFPNSYILELHTELIKLAKYFACPDVNSFIQISLVYKLRCSFVSTFSGEIRKTKTCCAERLSENVLYKKKYFVITACFYNAVL